MSCPFCGGASWLVRRTNDRLNIYFVYQCSHCGRQFTTSVPKPREKKNK
jgi:transcription elongation factor Elf1